MFKWNQGEVLYTSKLRGYETPLEESCIKSRLKMETLNTLLSVMKKNLPDIREYLKIKADYLGYQNGLPWFELYALLLKMMKTIHLRKVLNLSWISSTHSQNI